jgi:hypothetical protein
MWGCQDKVLTYNNRAAVLVCQWHVESPLSSSRKGGVITVEIHFNRNLSCISSLVLQSTHNLILPTKSRADLARPVVVTSVRPLILLTDSRVNLARRVIATAV